MATQFDPANPNLRRRFRGYDRQEVRAALHDLLTQLAERTAERTELQQALAAAERDRDRLMQMEEAISRALVSAHKSAQDTTDSARREAEKIVDEARERAQRIAEDADARMEAAALRRSRFERDLRDLIGRLTGELDAETSARDAQPAAAQGPQPGKTVTITSVRPALSEDPPSGTDILGALRSGTDGPR